MSERNHLAFDAETAHSLALAHRREVLSRLVYRWLFARDWLDGDVADYLVWRALAAGQFVIELTRHDGAAKRLFVDVDLVPEEHEGITADVQEQVEQSLSRCSDRTSWIGSTGAMKSI